MNYAAWTRVDIINPNLAPEPRCDHSSATIGLSTFLTYGGGAGTESYFVPDDVWTFDVLLNSWTRLEISGSRPPVRSGFGMLYSPSDNSVYVVAAFTSGESYLSDTWIFSLDTLSWIRSIPDSGSPVPPPRGWVRIAWSDLNSSTILLFGGLDYETDLGDLWNYSFQTHTWLEYPAICLEFGQVCTNVFDDFYSAVLNVTNSSSHGVEVIDSTLVFPRPAYEDIWIAAFQQWADMFATDPWRFNSTVCLDGCVKSGQGVVSPPGAEGIAFETVGTKSYLYGGYTCAKEGVVSAGGPSCYIESVWVLDLPSGLWTEIAKPDDPGALQRGNWPSSPRAYHSVTNVNGKLWMFGGSFIDATLTNNFRNDVIVFDTATLSWEPVKIFGESPSRRWSHTATLLHVHGYDSIYVFAGCAGDNFYNDLYVLKIDAILTASNVFVDPAALGQLTCLANEQCELDVTMRDTRTNETLTWASGLASTLRGVVVSQYQKQTFATTLTVHDLSEGRYLLSWIVQYGPSAQLFVFFDDVEVTLPTAYKLIAGGLRVAGSDPVADKFILELPEGRIYWYQRATVLVFPRDQYDNLLMPCANCTAGFELMGNYNTKSLQA
jgi:hypothetical protein